jgi:hypothetical protein
MSIKALAIKALHGNRQGNSKETVSCPTYQPGVTVAEAENAFERGKIPYTIFYAPTVNDFLLFVNTPQEAVALRQQGIEEAIYCHAEIKSLMGKTQAEIRAYHAIKKAYPEAGIKSLH